MTDPNVTLDLDTVSKYLKTHKNWPKEKQIKAKAEGLVRQCSVTKQVQWFESCPPSTGEGCIGHVVALSHTAPEKAKTMAKSYWHKKTFMPQERESFLKHASRMLTEQDHLTRINHLFFETKYEEIPYLLHLIKNHKVRKNIHLRLCIAKNQVVYSQKPLQHFEDGLRYQWARFCRINRKDDEAYQWLTQNVKDDPNYAEQWWFERNMISRRFIDYAFEHPKKRSIYLKKAYDVIAHHGLTAGEKFADACFLRGFLQYQLGHSGQAYQIFKELYERVKSPMSKSRAAYWTGLAAMKAKNGQSEFWFGKAAQYSMTFYGQVACLRLKKNIPLTTGLSSRNQARSAKVSGAQMDPRLREDDSITAVLHLFDKSTPRGTVQDFCTAAICASKNLSEAAAICAIVQKKFDPDIFIKTCKQAGFKFGVNPMGHKDLPTLKLPKGVGCTPLEWATVHAIIYRESQFALCEKSDKGALGLMQLVPKTAHSMAKRLGIPLKNDWDIMNQEKNILLGSHNFKHVLDMRKGNYLLALCDYNTAMSNVHGWLKMYGDPRCKNVDVIEWIEFIPFFETRAYVIRVLENVVNYLLVQGKQEEVKNLLRRERVVQ